MKSSKPVAIVGAAESDLGKVPGMTSLDLQAQAAARARRGPGAQDVDGVFAHVDDKFAGLQLAEYLGIRPRYVDSTSVGGMSNVMHVRHAMAAIQAGMCEVALVAGSSCRTARARSARAEDMRMPRGQFITPYGQLSPIGYYAMVAQLHAALRHHPSRPGGSGGGGAQMGAAQSPCLPARGHVDRRGDGLAPDRGPAAPARLLPGDRCRRRLHPDHGRARPLLRRPPVHVLGIAESFSHHYTPFNTSDWLDTNVAATADAALAMAGVTRQDIDVVQIYDHFTIGVIQSLEELGFCERGEGGAFVAGGRLAPGGTFPSTPRAAACPTTIPGSSACCCCSKRCTSCARNAASGNCPRPSWRWCTRPAWCFPAIPP